MRLLSLLLVLLALLWCVPACAAAAIALGRGAAPGPATLQADAVELDLNRNTAEATGHARLDYQNLRLFADHITANRTTGDVHAEGHLEVIQGARRLTGETLSYNTNTQVGSITQARLLEQGVIIRGARLDFSPQQVVATNASFTTCDRPRPDYEIRASRIVLTATQPTRAGATPTSGRLSLKHAHIVFHGHRILALPSYTTTVGQIQAHRASLLPTGGISHLDGPYASFGYSFSRPKQPVAATLQLRVTSLRGVRGFLDIHRPLTPSGPAEAFLRLSRREDTTETDLDADQVSYSTANVLVSREPELGVRVADHRLTRRLHLRADAAMGRYSELRLDEDDRHVTANRASLTALVAMDPYPIAPRFLLSHAIGARYSEYSAGDHLALGFLRNTISYDFGTARRLSLSYIQRGSSGVSPFEFDSIGIAHELLGDLRYRVNARWAVRLMDAYDLRKGHSRDMVLSATRTAHCLEYTVGWRKLRGTFFFGIGIVPAGAQATPPPPPSMGPVDTAPMP